MVKYSCRELGDTAERSKEPGRCTCNPKDCALARMYTGIDILCRILAGCAVILTIKELFNGI